MAAVTPKEHVLQPEERSFYCRTLSVLEPTGIEVLVGGAYAFARYTGIERHTKDLDIFVRPTDFPRTLQALAAAGYVVEESFPHWLGKARSGEYFVDVIHCSGNGVATVDDEWFEHAPMDFVFELPVRLTPVEEMIWAKAFIQERERFDGADVAHLLLARGARVNWRRLLRRFGSNWSVLFAHLVLFGFIYPGERDRVPGWVMDELTRRLNTSRRASPRVERLCRGTLLSREQYLVDIREWGFSDARRLDENPMSDADIAVWTAAIADDGSKAS